jgi:hypothetical protein
MYRRRRRRRMYNRGGPNQEQTAAVPTYKGLCDVCYSQSPNPIDSTIYKPASDRIPLTKRTG